MTEFLEREGFTLRPVQPFNFAQTVAYHTRFQVVSGADVYQYACYSRLLERDGKLLLLSVRSRSSHNTDLLLTGEVASESLTPQDVEFACQQASWILGIDLDLRPFYKMCQDDQVLRSIAGTLEGLHPSRTPSVFEALVLAIVGQQIAGRVAQAIRTGLIQALGRSLVELDGQVYYTFPSPEAFIEVGVEGLRELKLSARKAEYIVEIASLAQEGVLDKDSLSTLSNEEVIDRLCKLRGVGLWTAHWVLIRALGRTDVFPSGDLALRRTLASFYFNGRAITQEEATDFVKRWAPYQSLVATYLFAAERDELQG